MITVPLPERLGSARDDAIWLRDTLLFADNIEVHVHSWQQRLFVRVSAQICNEIRGVERLIQAIGRFL